MFIGILGFFKNCVFCRVEKNYFCNRLPDPNFCFWRLENEGTQRSFFARTGPIKFKKSRKPRKNEKSAHRVTEGNPAPSLVCAIQILNKFFLYRQIAFANSLYCLFLLPRVFERTRLARMP